MRIVFHGLIASAFSVGLNDLLTAPAEIAVFGDDLVDDAQRRAYAAADVLVSFRFDSTTPRPNGLKLLHLPGAGYDAVDFAALPPAAVVCNCFGHEQAIAEYVFATLLLRQVPLVESDRQLRQGDWTHRAGPASSVHTELAGKTIGLLGYGHIGRAVAVRAKAFEMQVHVANRSAVAPSGIVDRAFGLDELPAFWGSADFFVVSLPLTAETTAIVNADSFAAMRRTAVVVNVGRGAVIEESAFYEALSSGRIGGAVIDTWYQYPTTTVPRVHPSTYPFHELPNVLLTPHMSGWTDGTIRRRQRVIADNIGRRMRGEPCINVVGGAQG